jgi:hypothetical protein
MKRTWIILLVFSILPAGLRAQVADNPKQLEELRKRLYDAVKPTADQEVQLDQILQTHRQALENWRRQNLAVLQAARELQADAVRSDDRGTLQAVGKEIRDMMDSRRVLHQTMMHQMEDVLDEKQFARVREILLPARTGSDVLRLLPHIKLTEIQNAEVRKILEQAAVRAKAKKDRAEKEEIMDQAVEDIRQTVLSETQRNTLQTLLRREKARDRRREMLSGMDFTDEQKARIKTILAEARKKAQTVDTPREKQAILAEAHRTIRRDVWTQKQRDQLFLGQIETYRQQLKTFGLTSDQLDQAEKILTTAHEKAQASGNDEEKRQILREAVGTIRRTVLNPDQREKMK